MTRCGDARKGDEVLCLVCGHPLPDGQATYHADLGIRTHDACSPIVDGFRRDYSASARGRWRPRTKVLQLIRQSREARP